jgi:hypothetical protein
MKKLFILEFPKDHPELQQYTLMEPQSQLDSVIFFERLESKTIKELNLWVMELNKKYPKLTDVFLHDFDENFFKKLSDIVSDKKVFQVVKLDKSLTLRDLIVDKSYYVHTINGGVVDSCFEQDYWLKGESSTEIDPISAMFFEVDLYEQGLTQIGFDLDAAIDYDENCKDFKMKNLNGGFNYLRIGYFQDITPQDLEGCQTIDHLF